jgi:hypothetical protein
MTAEETGDVAGRDTITGRWELIHLRADVSH